MRLGSVIRNPVLRRRPLSTSAAARDRNLATISLATNKYSRHTMFDDGVRKRTVRRTRRMSRDNVLSFLSMNLARLASSATQLSPIRRQLSSACALMQAGGQPGKLAGLQPEQSSSAQATPGRYLKRAKRAPWPPWIVNEVSSVQVREPDRAICAVTGHRRRLDYAGDFMTVLCGIARKG